MIVISLNSLQAKDLLFTMSGGWTSHHPFRSSLNYCLCKHFQCNSSYLQRAANCCPRPYLYLHRHHGMPLPDSYTQAESKQPYHLEVANGFALAYPIRWNWVGCCPHHWVKGKGAGTGNGFSLCVRNRKTSPFWGWSWHPLNACHFEA